MCADQAQHGECGIGLEDCNHQKAGMDNVTGIRNGPILTGDAVLNYSTTSLLVAQAKPELYSDYRTTTWFLDMRDLTLELNRPYLSRPT